MKEELFSLVLAVRLASSEFMEYLLYDALLLNICISSNKDFEWSCFLRQK